MVAPLHSQQIENALQHGSQEELDEFHRLVEKAHMEILDPQVMDAKDKARLKVLRDKLFPLETITP